MEPQAQRTRWGGPFKAGGRAVSSVNASKRPFYTCRSVLRGGVVVDGDGGRAFAKVGTVSLLCVCGLGFLNVAW